MFAVIAASTAVAWVAVGDSATQTTEAPDIEAVTTALAVVRQVQSLADAATVSTHPSMTSEILAESRASLDASVETLYGQINDLQDAGYEQASATMRELTDELARKSAAIEDRRPALAEVRRESERRRQEIIAMTNWELVPAAVASEDDVFYGLITDDGDAVSPEDLLRYSRLALLTQQVDQGSVLLEVAARQSDVAFVATVEENVDLVMYQLSDSLEVFAEDTRQDLQPTLIPLASGLVDGAYGEANMIDMMKTRLGLAAQEAREIAAINGILASLQTEASTVLSQSIGRIGSTDGYGGTAELLNAALTVDQHVSSVAAASITRTTPTTPLADLPAARDAAAADLSGIRQRLDVLDSAGHGDAVVRMRTTVDSLQSDVEGIHDGRPGLVEALQSAGGQRAQLRAFFDYQLRPAVVASLDNQLYYMLTGRSEFPLEGPTGASDPLSREELLRYRHLTLVFNSLFRTFSGLIIAIIISEPALIAEAEERFATAAHRLESSVAFLEQEGGAQVHPQLVPLARQFVAFGNGDANFFDSLRHRLPLIAQEAELIESGRQATLALQADVNTLLDEVLQDTATLDPNAHDPDARVIVLVIGIVAVIATLLIAASVARRRDNPRDTQMSVVS
ncbi:MAG: hypothetical protein F4011_12655 [Acidimicrobiaceae bacterium]|nr:hypothetical protein [Acidimicrobiaceae bacterium]MYL05015.1 hypothetical protein [Acidimicrobiaceae bacterium]